MKKPYFTEFIGLFLIQINQKKNQPTECPMYCKVELDNTYVKFGIDHKILYITKHDIVNNLMVSGFKTIKSLLEYIANNDPAIKLHCVKNRVQ